MRSVRISWRSAQRILSLLRDIDGASRGLCVRDHDIRDELAAAMAPKRSVKLAKVRKTAKRKTKKAERQDVREEVFARANGECECGCGAAFSPHNPGELDHAFGRARSESLETCWALNRLCHRQKTEGRPSASYWLHLFARHCDRHTYYPEAAKARSRLSFVEARETLGAER